MCFGVVAVASVLQMSVGMGFGMLAAPMIALIKPEIVPGAILTMGLVVAFSGAWRERKNISFNELKLGFGGRFVGSMMAFICLLFIPDIDAFLITFGLIMLIAILITASGLQLQFNDKNLLGLSVVSGVMGTMTAVGAPPMAIIYHDRPPATVRPTLNAFFGAGSVLGMVSLSVSGWLDFYDIVAAILLLPALVLGVIIAEPFKSMPSRVLSRVLLFLSSIASLILVLRGLGYLN